MKRFTFLHWSGRGSWGRQGLSPGAVIIGMVWALSVTVAATMATGFWVMFSSKETFYLAGLLSAVTFTSIAVGGVISGRLAGNLGWLHGISVGFFYVLLLGALTVLVSPSALTILPVVLKVFSLLLAGALGGVLGVNLPGRRRAYRRLPY